MKPTEDELRTAVREAIESPDYQRLTNPPVQTGYLVGAVRRKWPGEYTASDALAIVERLRSKQ